MNSNKGWWYRVIVTLQDGSTTEKIIRGSKSEAMAEYENPDRKEARIFCYRGSVLQWSKLFRADGWVFVASRSPEVS